MYISGELFPLLLQVGSLGFRVAAAAVTDDRCGTSNPMVARCPLCSAGWLWEGLAEPCDLYLHSFLCFISGICMSCFTVLSCPSPFPPG